MYYSITWIHHINSYEFMGSPWHLCGVIGWERVNLVCIVLDTAGNRLRSDPGSDSRELAKVQSLKGTCRELCLHQHLKRGCDIQIQGFRFACKCRSSRGTRLSFLWCVWLHVVRPLSLTYRYYVSAHMQLHIRYSVARIGVKSSISSCTCMYLPFAAEWL